MTHDDTLKFVDEETQYYLAHDTSERRDAPRKVAASLLQLFACTYVHSSSVADCLYRAATYLRETTA